MKKLKFKLLSIREDFFDLIKDPLNFITLSINDKI